jgi:hypothetical protein
MVCSEKKVLLAGGWFVLREMYCWLVADKPSKQGVGTRSRERIHSANNAVAKWGSNRESSIFLGRWGSGLSWTPVSIFCVLPSCWHPHETAPPVTRPARSHRHRKKVGRVVRPLLRPAGNCSVPGGRAGRSASWPRGPAQRHERESSSPSWWFDRFLRSAQRPQIPRGWTDRALLGAYEAPTPLYATGRLRRSASRAP